MKIANVIAEGMCAIAGDDCVHIYDDGLIIVLTVSVERRHEIKNQLRKHFDAVALGTSEDDLYTAFVIWTEMPRSVLPETKGFVYVMTLTDGYNDHRNEDTHTIEQAKQMMARLANIAP